MQKIIILYMLACMLISMTSTIMSAEVVKSQKRPVVWMIPPPWNEGACLKELINQDSKWRETRSEIDGLGCYFWLLNHQFSNNELIKLFRKLDKWNLKFSFEMPVVKGANWGFPDPLNAKTSFDKFLEIEKRLKTCGLKRVDAFAFDEPIYASRHMIPYQISQGVLPRGTGLPEPELTGEQRMQYGIKETVSFIEMMRKACPDAQLGDIEPYPVLTYDEIVFAIDNIQSECAKKGIKGLEFFRMDIDWASMIKTNTGSWLEVKKIEEYCRSKGIAFGMIYWAPDHEFLKPKGIDNDMAWYIGLMHHGNAYALVDGAPDECVIESWMHIPVHAVPESDITSFTKSVLDFCKFFIPEKTQAKTDIPDITN